MGTSETSAIRSPSTSTSTPSRSSSPMPSKILPWRNTVLMSSPCQSPSMRSRRVGRRDRRATPAAARTLSAPPTPRRRSIAPARPRGSGGPPGSVTFRRFSLMSIVWWASHCCHAGFETCSNTRLPRSPGRGGKSSPSASCLSFTHCTVLAMVIASLRRTAGARLSRIAGDGSIGIDHPRASCSIRRFTGAASPTSTTAPGGYQRSPPGSATTVP